MDKIVCSKCGKEMDRYDAIMIEGEFLCEDCLEENYAYCEYHNDYEPKDEVSHVISYNGVGYYMCKYGMDEYFRVCYDCGHLVPYDEARYDYDDEEYLCPTCYQERKDNEVIKNYHQSHEIERQFFGESTDGIYMGFEIETERDNMEDSLNSIAKAVKNDHTDNLLFFERDGSLCDGFETITNPLSYEFIVNNNIISSIVNSLSKYGMYASHRCGLHIHITRTKKVEEMLPSIVMFMENNKEDMIAFSNRTRGSFYEWCDFHTDSDDNDIILLDSLKIISNSCERHTCLNMTNNDTIEFRCFAGTLDADRIMGYIEFVNIMISEKVKDFKELYEIAERNGYKNLMWVLGCSAVAIA